jgi:hypothetical protein
MIVFVLGNGLRCRGAGMRGGAAAAMKFRHPDERCRYSMLCTSLLIFPWTSHWLRTWGYATTSAMAVCRAVREHDLALDRFDDLEPRARFDGPWPQ